MKKLRTPTQDETGTLIAMLAVIFGGWVRLFIPYFAGFPINDGGLFYVMVKSLQANGLQLPLYVHYNGLDIPFAYPPLGFYLGAIVSDLLHLDAIVIFQWLPAVVMVIAIPAFYFLAKVVLESSYKAGIATLLYAFTPRAITWQIMGGGLTRSLGQLLLMIALANIYLLFAKRDRKHLVLSIILSSLVVLTHPEATIQAVGIALLFWLFKGRDKQSILYAILVGMGTMIATAIWWLPVLLRFGLAPILSAGSTGLLSIYAFFYPLLLTFTDEPLLTILAVLAVIGFAVQIARKDYLIPAWFLLPFFVEPRSAPTVAMLPLALLAGISVSDLILPALSDFESRARHLEFENFFQSRAVQFFMLFIGFYLLGSAFYFGTQIAGASVTLANRQAFDWIKSNTPADSRFLVLTGDKELFCNGTQEWFPALTDRVSLTTLQGREWLDGKRFVETMGNLQAIQDCLDSDSALSCLKKQTAAAGMEYDYIYITRSAPIKMYCRASGVAIRGQELIAELTQNPQERLVYQTEAVAIFSLQR